MIGAIAIGLAGGVVAGMLGVGGGVLFVPGLVLFLGLGQHQAEATSLLAIVPVAIAGAVNQDRFGNVQRRDAAVIGVLSIAGAIGGVALANTLSAKALRDIFAALILLVAVRLVRTTLRQMRQDKQASRRSHRPIDGPIADGEAPREEHDSSRAGTP